MTPSATFVSTDLCPEDAETLDPVLELTLTLTRTGWSLSPGSIVACILRTLLSSTGGFRSGDQVIEMNVFLKAATSSYSLLMLSNRPRSSESFGEHSLQGLSDGLSAIGRQ